MDHYEYSELLKMLKTKMENIGSVVRPDKLEARLKEIEVLEHSDGFWNDAASAATVQQEKTQLER
ncbi:MAG: peptide chain release factor 2, partial [Thiovulaceae bacterium]|nr:peptide chain release factor 2 [Sulfurimonadaceae bacterium]